MVALPSKANKMQSKQTAASRKAAAAKAVRTRQHRAPRNTKVATGKAAKVAANKSAKASAIAKAAPSHVNVPSPPVMPQALTPQAAAAAFTAAKTKNAAIVLGKQPAIGGANLARPPATSNLSRARVYMYANAAQGGGVPLNAYVTLVTPNAPSVPGITAQQWPLLVKLAANGTLTVQQLYAQGIRSRTMRRAFRRGAIAFSTGQATSLGGAFGALASGKKPAKRK